MSPTPSLREAKRRSNLIVLLAAVLVTPFAAAHPLGNYSINQYTLFELRGEVPRIYYQLDVAEIPSLKEMDLLDQDLNNEASAGEMQAYLDKRVPDLFNNLELTLNGERVPLVLTSRRMEVYEGVGSMPVFNVFLAAEPQSWRWPEGDFALEFRSYNTETAQGYREAYALLDGRFSVGVGPWKEKELKYLALILQDEKENPIFQSFYNRFRLELSPNSGHAIAAPPAIPDFSWTATAKRNPGEEMTLASQMDWQPMALVQTITVAEAPPVEEPPPAGPTTAPESVSAAPPSTDVSATASAVSSGPNVTVAQGRRPAAPAQSETTKELLDRVTNVLRTKELTPGLVVFALLVSAILGVGHAFTPGHGKTVMAAYLIGERGTMWHALILGIVVTITHVWSILALGVVSLYFTDRISEQQFTFWTGIVSGIIIVALGLFLLQQRYARYVLSRPGGSFDPDDHAHHHMIHTHDGIAHSHAPGDDDARAGLPLDGEMHEHSHGVFTHSHVVETKDGTPPTYKSILWLGISGGIVPCPAAFIVLMLAINLGRLALGLLLILTFSLGLASVLVALGIAVVRASGHIRKRIGARGRVLLALPVFSAALITLLGLGLVIQTLIQHGVIIIPESRG